MVPEGYEELNWVVKFDLWDSVVNSIEVRQAGPTPSSPLSYVWKDLARTSPCLRRLSRPTPSLNFGAIPVCVSHLGPCISGGSHWWRICLQRRRWGQEIRIGSLSREDPLEEGNGNSSILAWKIPTHGVSKESHTTGQLNNNKIYWFMWGGGGIGSKCGMWLSSLCLSSSPSFLALWSQMTPLSLRLPVR